MLHRLANNIVKGEDVGFPFSFLLPSSLDPLSLPTC